MTAWGGRVLTPALGLGIVALLVPVHLRPENFPTDDAYFYLQVAEHIASGHGSTFNGITRTNGYHPLWMLVCVGASSLAGGDKRLALHIVLAVQQLLFAAALVLLYRLGRRLRLVYGYAAVPFLAAGLMATANHGVESSLNAFLLLACLLAVESAARRDTRAAWLGCGALLGLCVLARLDNVFVAAALAAAAARAAGHGWKRAAFRFCVCSPALGVLVAPYLLYNLLSFHHWMPVSGAIKSRFPEPRLHTGTLGAIGLVAGLGGVAAILAAARLHGTRRWLMAALGSGVVLHGMYMLLFVQDNMLTWAWVAGIVNLGLVAAVAAEALVPRAAAVAGESAARALLAMGSVAVLGLAAARVWSDYHNPDARGAAPFQFRRLAASKWQNEIALWLRANVPPGSRIFAHQWPGAIAYFSDLPCLPEDGLMTEFDYDRELEVVGIEDYLESHGVRLFLGPYPPWVRSGAGWEQAPRLHDGWRVEIRSPLGRRSAGAVMLRDEALVVRFDTALQHPSMPGFGLWRLANGRPGAFTDRTKKRPSPE